MFRGELERLRTELDCDFCALALLDNNEYPLRWKLASGSQNDRFLAMADKPGRGLSGTVMKVGRAMSLQVADLIRTRELHEYPILISEKLRSAYAVPLMNDGKVNGILLFGDRKKRIYRPEDRASASLGGERISMLC